MFLTALQRILKSHVFKKDNSIKSMTFIALPRSQLILTVLPLSFSPGRGDGEEHSNCRSSWVDPPWFALR